jgi:hypothetical protein
MALFRKHDPVPVLTFTCERKDEGVIAPPLAAKSYTPDWFRRLPAVDETRVSPTDTGLTVKRCMPFLDAMHTGWLIPLAATVRLKVSEGGSKVDAGWEFDRPLVATHGMHQVRGNAIGGNRPPMKFLNYWTIRTTPGWSCLFVDPLNRPNGLFQIVAGIVDTDTYTAPIHFPFFATAPDGLHEIAKGSPMVQVIPFRRETTHLAAEIRSETEAEADARQKVRRLTDSTPGWYRTDARAPR